MFTQKFIKTFHLVQEIGLFSLFQNWALCKASTKDKCHFAISYTRCRQYQCVCKSLSKYSKWFKNYRHFSRTGRGQNLHKLSGDKIKCLIIGHSMKVTLKVDFLRVVQWFGMPKYRFAFSDVSTYFLICSGKGGALASNIASQDTPLLPNAFGIDSEIELIYTIFSSVATKFNGIFLY